MILRHLRQAMLAVAVPALLAGSAFGQQPAPANPAQPAAGAAPAQPAAPPASPSHMAAAIDYLVASSSTKGFEDDIPKLVNQLRLNYSTRRPEIATFINDAALAIIPEAVRKRDDLNRRLAVFYAKYFTEDELKQLTQFYRSPLGAKLANNQIEIIKESVPEIQKWRDELIKSIDARLKEEVKKKGQTL